MDPLSSIGQIFLAVSSTPTLIILGVSILVLIFLSSGFAASETSFMSASKIRLKILENNGSKKASKVLKKLENPDIILNTSLIGNNIVTIVSASLATLFFGGLIYSEAIATLVSSIVMTIIILAIADIIPKSIAKEHPEKAAMFFYNYISFWRIILYPFIAFFGLWRKIYKSKPQEAHTTDELLTIVEEAENENEEVSDELKLIKAAIEFEDIDVYDIMVPRVNVISVSDEECLETISKIYAKHEFSRLPVYHGTIDTIIGILNEKDFNKHVLTKEQTLKDAVTKSICLSSSMKISAALKELQKARSQMAIVVDEFGGTAGIVTMEDILEELVGEIYDEHDEEEILVKNVSDNVYIIAGQERLEKCFEVMDFDTKEEFTSSTVGGWVMEMMEKIPLRGEGFNYTSPSGKNLKVKVTKATARRVTEVKIEVLDEEDTKEEN
ncbi:MAG: hemolysin family protein [Firmicutes bacterium]|nr:hemolysin family protein [Bacillota bacterium]